MAIPLPFPLPSPQQQALLRLAKGGDKDARDQLVLTSQRLVHDLVNYYLRKFHIGTLEREDFVQAGVEALLESIDRFNLTYTNAFTTYATYRIRHRLNELVAQQTLPMRVNMQTYRRMPRQRMVRLQTSVPLFSGDEAPFLSQLTTTTDYPDYYNLELLRHSLAVRGLLTTKQKDLLLSWAGAGKNRRIGEPNIRGAMARLKWYMTNLPMIKEG